LSDQFHSEAIVGDPNTLVVRDKPPTLQGLMCGASECREKRRHLDGRGFKTGPDSLHAIIGFDQDLSEVCLVRNSEDFYTGHSKTVVHALSDAGCEQVSSSLRDHVGNRPLKRHETSQSVTIWINAAADQRIATTAGRVRAQHRNQVLKKDHGAATTDADGPAGRIFHPPFRGPGNDDVGRIGITEHILHSMQAREVAHGVIGFLTGRKLTPNRLLKTDERDLAQLRTSRRVRCDASPNRCQPLGVQQGVARVGFDGQDPARIDRDTEGRQLDVCANTRLRSVVGTNGRGAREANERYDPSPTDWNSRFGDQFFQREIGTPAEKAFYRRSLEGSDQSRTCASLSFATKLHTLVSIC
jgi:hypothetical protein